MGNFLWTEINYWAVLVGAAVYFLIGAFWYSPVLFGKMWARLQQVDMNDKEHRKGMGKMMAISFFSQLIMAMGMAFLVQVTGAGTFAGGLVLGLVAGLAFTGTAITITFLFEKKPPALYFIDIGHHLAGFLALGIILSLWQ